MGLSGIFRIGLALWALLSLGAAAWLATLNPGNIAVRVRVFRSRVVGAVTGFAALALTVPQAGALLWDWLLPWYVPIIAVFGILCVIYIDCVGSRGIAGLVMMAAYYFLHCSFALKIPFALIGCCLSWLAAAAAVAVAAKPCWMRDGAIFLAGHGRSRIAAAAVTVAAALYCAYESVVL